MLTMAIPEKHFRRLGSAAIGLPYVVHSTISLLSDSYASRWNRALTQSYVQCYFCCIEFPKPIGYGLRVQWILYSIATNSAVVVSISFWSFIIIFVNNSKLYHIYQVSTCCCWTCDTMWIV